VPLVLGVGIATPAAAHAAASIADGVIVGSAIVRRVMEAPDPMAAGASLREAVAEFAEAMSR
jgi:tryptophan synthase alpha chain